MSRRELTSEQIRGAARAEFSLAGPRAFSLQGVSKRAFVSIGAVYERWPNADACIQDLVKRELPLAVDHVIAPWVDSQTSIDQLVLHDFTNPVALADLRFIVECVFAARDAPGLAEAVLSETERLGHAIGGRIRLPAAADAIDWWVASAWLGHALLRTSGCPIPSTFASELAALIRDASDGSDRGSSTTFDLAPALPLPEPSRPNASDSTGIALVQAAADLILESGVDAADTRSIARQAGLSTGAIYRRFDGKGEVLDDVLKSELTPERYMWVKDFAKALSSENGPDAAAEHLASLVARTWREERSAHLLLEITVAAHTDERVLAGVIREITKVADAREQLLSQFVNAGFIRPGLSASTMAWLLQIPPVGMRILASIGYVPTDDQLVALMKAYLFLVLADNEPSV